MNKDLKNGLLVAGGAVLLYLLYKQATKKSDIVVAEKKEQLPTPIEVDLPIDRPRPIEAVMIDAPINL